MTSEQKKRAKAAGKILGRAGLATAVQDSIKEYEKDPSYKRAIFLAGVCRAIATACEYDTYWDEKQFDGVICGLDLLEFRAANMNGQSK